MKSRSTYSIWDITDYTWNSTCKHENNPLKCYLYEFGLLNISFALEWAYTFKDSKQKMKIQTKWFKMIQNLFRSQT